MHPHKRPSRVRRARLRASRARAQARTQPTLAPLTLEDAPEERCRVRVKRGNLEVSFVCADERALDTVEGLDVVAQDAIRQMAELQASEPGRATMPLVEGGSYRIRLAHEPELAVGPAGLMYRERVYTLEDDVR